MLYAKVKKKQTLKRLKDLAWKEFSKYIRTKYSKNGYCKCVTCGKIAPIKEMQAGHFVSGRTNSVLFDEDLVRPQCFGCNYGQGGEYARYFLYFKKCEGKSDEELEEYLNRKHKIVKYTPQDLIDIRNKYIKKCKELENESIYQ